MDFRCNAVCVCSSVFAGCLSKVRTLPASFQGPVVSRFSVALALALLPGPVAFAAGDAGKGRAEWEHTCQHCHGTPQPNAAAAFSDFGPTANRLSVYANDPAAITKAATLGYTIPEGNTNDKEPPGGSTNRPMGTWAGMAPNRLGLGAEPTQFARNVSAYFASLFEAPGAPAISGVTPGHGQATVSFTAPRSDLDIAGYTVTTSPGGQTATGAQSPVTVSGLSSGTAYSFTVTATSNAGTGSPSAPSAKVTLAAGQGGAVPAVAVPAGPPKVAAPAVPNSQAAASAPAIAAPVIKFAKAGNAQARIFFDATAGVTYTVTAFAQGAPTGITATGSKSPIAVSGLTNGMDYTFTLTASGGKGPGVTSAPSSAVTPLRLLGD